MKIFESDLTEAIFEVLANTDFKNDGLDFINSNLVKNDSIDIELDKDNACIEITDNENNSVFKITITKTHQF